VRHPDERGDVHLAAKAGGGPESCRNVRVVGNDRGQPRGHQLQTLVSRQGETIDDIGPLRARLATLRSEAADQPIPCPVNWGAIRLVPDAIEFWKEG
jgi:pyridoxine/pyridoxamine 5'-phosphate oxidase